MPLAVRGRDVAERHLALANHGVALGITTSEDTGRRCPMREIETDDGLLEVIGLVGWVLDFSITCGLFEYGLLVTFEGL